MRVIAKKTLREFWESHADSEDALKAWHYEANKAAWSTPNDIKLEYPSVSILEDNRFVFNIKGNHYRLIVRINFEIQIIWIRFIGTHAEYDKIDANIV